MSDFSTPGDIDLYPGDKKTKDFYIIPAEGTNEKGAIPYNANVISTIVTCYDSDDNVVTDLVSGTPTMTNNIVTITFIYPSISGNGRYRVKIFCDIDNGDEINFNFERVVARTH